LHAALKAYQNFYSRQATVEAALHVAKHLADTNEPLKAEVVLNNLPVGAREEYPSIQPVQDLVDERLAHMRNPIAYRNFYTASENQVDPVEELAQGNMYPRMLWLLERLKANNVRTVLNVGIGSGFDTLLYAQNGIRAVGIDVDPKRVKDCNLAAVKAGHMALIPAPDHSPMAQPQHLHGPDCLVTDENLVTGGDAARYAYRRDGPVPCLGRGAGEQVGQGPRPL